MKSVNFQLDDNNSLEITQVENNLFEVRLGINGSMSIYYMTRDQLLDVEQLGGHICIGTLFTSDIR